MKDSPGKSKLTLKSLLLDQRVITGKGLVERQKALEQEAKRQKTIMDEAIEFEFRNRKAKQIKK